VDGTPKPTQIIANYGIACFAGWRVKAMAGVDQEQFAPEQMPGAKLTLQIWEAADSQSDQDGCRTILWLEHARL